MPHRQCQCFHPAQALAEVILPWVADHQRDWKSAEAGRATILVPSRGVADWLREQLSRQFGAVLDIAVFTPTFLRTRLRDRGWIDGVQDTQWLSPADIQLFVMLSLESGVVSERDIPGWVKLYQDLDRVGFIPDWLKPEQVALLEQVQRFVMNARLLSEPQFDRQVLSRALEMQDGNDREFERLLVYGFGPRDLEGIQFLLGCCLLAETSTVVHPAPSLHIGEQVWFDTWEKYFGRLEMFHVEHGDLTHHLLAESIREGSPTFNTDKTLEGRLAFHRGGQLTGVVATAVSEVVAAIESIPEDRLRVALVLPQNRAEMRWALRDGLERLALPYFDRIPGRAAEWQGVPGYWLAWCEFQRLGSIDAFAAFVEQCVTDGQLSEDLAGVIQRAVDRGFQLLQTTRWTVLHAYVLSELNDRSGETGVALRGFLEQWALLPERWEFEHFAKAVLDLSQLLGEHTERIDDWLRPRLEISVDAETTREAFFKWIMEHGRRSLLNAPRGDQPAGAKIHLVDFREALAETWSHIIVAECSAADWQINDVAQGLLDEDERSRLNTEAVIDGGGQVLLPGRLPLLDAARRNENVDRFFFDLLMQPLDRVVFLAQDILDDAPGLVREPLPWITEWFERDYEGLRAVELPSVESSELHPVAAVERLSDAVQERYDDQRPFGDYDYGASSLRSHPEAFAAKEIEFLIKDPIAGWYHDILKQSPWSRYVDREERALWDGTRLHRWLEWSPGRGVFAPLPDRSAWIDAALRRAHGERVAVERYFAHVDQELPDSWFHLWWMQTAQIPRYIDSALELAASGWRQAGFEMGLPRGLRLGLGSDCVIQLSGRMDLVLANDDRPLAPTEVDPKREFLVVDFKSGSRGSITPKQILQGSHVQLVLYAAGLLALKSGPVSVCYVDRGQKSKPFAITLDPGRDLDRFVTGIRQMVSTGRFGIRPYVDREFSFSRPYPIAHVAIDDDVAAARWSLTHPLLATLIGP